MSKNYRNKLITQRRTRKMRPYLLNCSNRKISYSWLCIGDSAFSLESPGAFYSQMRSERKAHQYMRQKENKQARLILKNELRKELLN